MKNTGHKTAWLSGLSLFTSIGTLVCCALPALLVTLGMGAVLAGLVSSAPWLVTFSKYKLAVFSAAAVFLAAAGIMLWKSRSAPCPADRRQADSCRKLRKISTWIYGISVLLFATGFFFAFAAGRILV